ncbi:MAG: glycosyltransferase family 4 protein [Candidatus Helarchaeota archaeon]
MKILIIIHKKKKGGGAVLQILKIHSGLKEKGNKTRLFSIDNYEKSKLLLTNLFYSIMAFRKIVNSYKPDVILATDPYITTLFAILASKKRIPIVLRVGAVFDEFYAGRIKEKLFGEFFPSLFYKFVKKILFLISKILLRKIDFVIFNSYFLLEKYKKVVRRATVIYNGVNIDSKINIQTNENLKLIYVGRIEPRKSLEIIITAMSLLQKKGINCSLSIVGNIHQFPRYWNKIEQLISKYSLNSIISIEGTIKNSELPKILKKKDILLFSTDSRNFPITEGLPNVILEAMSNGLAIISTGIAGIPEILTEENGYIVEPKPKSFVNAIEQLNNDRLKLQKIKEKNIEAAKKLYNKEKMVMEYFNILKKIQKKN